MRKVLAIGFIFILLLIAGCSQEETGKNESAMSDKIVNIQFGELMDQNYNISRRVQELDGKKVSMTGFMAMQSPLDGSFIYLTNAPLVSCPYCIPGTSTPIYAIPVIAAPDKPITYTEQPVTITGVLEVTDKTDQLGYTTPFRINVESLSIADAAQMPQPLQEYAMLASDGVTIDILLVLDQLVAYTCYDLSELNPGMVFVIDLEQIDKLTIKVKGYGFSSFDPLLYILQQTNDLAIKINKLIENNEKELMINYSEEGMSNLNAYFEWADEMAIIK